MVLNRRLGGPQRPSEDSGVEKILSTPPRIRTSTPPPILSANFLVTVKY